MASKNSRPDFFKAKLESFQEHDLVKEYFLDGGGDKLLTLEATANAVNASKWLETNRPTAMSRLQQHGAILFRGFDVTDSKTFRDFMNAWNSEQMTYFDQSSPRTLIDERVYTSTDHPSTEIINWHSELSYSHQWPQFIAFNCHVPALAGGETFICDNRKVLDRLPKEVVEKFARHGILYERNLIPGLGLSWKTVYQTEDKSVVETYCKERSIDYRWVDDNHLRLIWRRPAVVSHPLTQEKIWFNHGYFFNGNNLGVQWKEVLREFSSMPFNTYYGNGEEIEEEVLQMLQLAYRAVTISTPWLKGDLLLLDNMLMSHGRNRFDGERKVVVGMSVPVFATQVN